jgi:hypothetical protein
MGLVRAPLPVGVSSPGTTTIARWWLNHGAAHPSIRPYRTESKRINHDTHDQARRRTRAPDGCGGSTRADRDTCGSQGRQPDRRSSRQLRRRGSWKLWAKHDDRRIEVEYEVDTNRPGQLWHVVLTDNAVGIFAGQRRTVAPSGSFTVSVRPPDRPGIDTIRAHATLGARSCGGTVRL